MRRRFRFLELILIVFGISLFSTSAFFYFSEISLRKLLLGWSDQFDQEKIGMTQVIEGSVKRKIAVVPEFQPISVQSDLFNYDTIITPSDGGATLRLKDGSTVELAANTMVKLVYQSSLGLNGLSQTTTVNLISGSAKGIAKTQSLILRSRDQMIDVNSRQGKQGALEIGQRPIAEKDPPPPPPPAPVKKEKLLVQLVQPQSKTLSIPKGSKKPELPLELKWKTDKIAQFLVELKQSGNQELILKEKVISDGKLVAVKAILNRPGSYEWKIQPESEQYEVEKKSALEGKFQLSSSFEGIEILDPLIGGKKVLSNVFTGKHMEHFDITLQWNPYPEVKDYLLQFYENAKSNKSVFKRNSPETKYYLNKNKVFSGNIYYQVTGKTSKGFTVSSARSLFSFKFMPPFPVLPESNAKISLSKPGQADQGVLFTWQKTNFTQYYEFQFSADPKFEKGVFTKKSEENFYILSTPKPGNYYWRLRSFAAGSFSLHTEPRKLVVTP